MKKIILILITLFLTTGCFNYLSLNDIAVVSLAHIDYQDNKYILTVEIRENEKDNPNASSIYTNQGESLDNAFENIGLTLNKFLYLVDVDTIILTENILNQKLETTLDYITRENNIGNNFNILVSNDDIKDITKIIKDKNKIIKDKNKIVGAYLKDTINNDYNNTIDIKYNKFIKTYLSEYKDMILPYGKIENKEFIINSAIIFNNNQDSIIINNDYIKIYNLLNNIIKYSLFKINYNEGNLIYRVKNVNTEYKYENNNINITINIKGNFNEIDNINLNKDNIEELISLTKDSIYNETSSFLNILKNNNIDVLGFKKIIYNSTKTKLDSIKELNYNLDVKVILDREEITFENIGAKKNEI